MWYVYEIPPIDLNWEFLKTVEETASVLAQQLARERVQGEDFGAPVTFEGFIADWKDAQRAASMKGWAGEFRDSPVVFWVPDDAAFSYGFAFKQDSNGTTYVVSPVPLQNIEALK